VYTIIEQQRMTRSSPIPGLLAIAILLSAFLAPRGLSQEKENSDFKMAVGLYNDGMYDLAVEQLTNFITAYPSASQSIDARFYLGLTQMKLRRFDEARITFQNFALAYVDNPRAPEAWRKVGDAFLELKNDREAASAYERIRVFHPKSALVPEALVKAAALYRSLGERESAKRALRTVVQDYPTSKSILEARLAIGEMYAEEGKIDLAEQEARRVSESEGPAAVKAAAMLSFGKLKAEESLFDEAEATFQSVVTRYVSTPAGDEALVELGKLELGDGDYTSAMKHLNTVASEDSADDSLRAEALFFIAQVYEKQHDLITAQKEYEELISKFPGSSLAELAMIESGRDALNERGGTDTARPAENIPRLETALRHAKEILPRSASLFRRQALIIAAMTSRDLKRYAEASQYFQSYAREYPNDFAAPEMLFELGSSSRNNASDYKKAITAFERILEDYPRSHLVARATRQIGECQEALGDFEAARKTYADLQNRYPASGSNPEIEAHIKNLEKHTIEHQRQAIEKIARLLGEVLTERSKARLSLRLGEIYFNDLQDYQDAAKQFSAAIDGDLGTDELSEAYYYRARSFEMQSSADPAYREKAISSYDTLLARFPDSKWSEDGTYFRFSLRSAPVDVPSGEEPKGVDASIQGFLDTHPTSAHRAAILFRLAEEAFLQKDYVRSIRLYDQGMIVDSSSPHLSWASLQNGESYNLLGKPDSALSCFRKAADAPRPDRFTLPAIRELADLYAGQKNYSEAIPLWKRITGEFFYTGNTDSVALQLAEAYLAVGNYDDAIRLYEASLKEQQSDPIQEFANYPLYFNLANAYQQKGDRQQAAEYYHKYLSNDRKGPFAAKSYYALGVFSRAQGRKEIASAYFKHATALGGAGTASRDIAELLFQTEQYSEAEKTYAALAESADSASTRKHYRAQAIVSMLRMDRTAEAQQRIAAFEKEFGNDKSSSAEFEFERAMVSYRKQDYAGAKKIFEKVANDYNETPFGPRGRYYIGKILEVTNQLDEAAKSFEDILKNFPASDVVPRVLLSLGNMHFNAERFEKAIDYYKQISDSAAEIVPFAMSNLIEAYESVKLYDAALKTTRDFIDRYPNDEAILDKKIKIGTLETKLGYYDQAVTQFQSLIGEAGSLLEAELRYNIGEAYYYKGDYQQAILEFLKVPYLVTKQGKVNWTATSFYMAGQSYEKISKFDEAIGMYRQIVDRSGIDASFKSAARKEIDRVNVLMKKESK
jgi:TolA-binding protein